MSSGPEPHSIPYSAPAFNRVSNYLSVHPEITGFALETAPASIPSDVLDAMHEIEFENYERDSINQVYYCGSGVVGKGWGFVHGPFSSKAPEDPGSVKFEGSFGRLSYLEKLDSNWYRFAVH